MAAFAVSGGRATNTCWREITWNIAERAGAALLLAAVVPPAILLGAAIASVSGRSPLIAHKRVGWRGRTLWMLKFRTMWDNGSGGHALLMERVAGFAGCAGVTHPLALWMRRYSVDEFPQLWHVVTGEMALVGPRPITHEELMEHYGPAAAEVTSIRPGLTGLWQTRGRSKLNYRQRRRYDLFLVRNSGPGFFAKILIRTVPAVWGGVNAW
jgi:lipopolysaccharide/colanic/teichoic acid biosynthesis glycosyltransferase